VCVCVCVCVCAGNVADMFAINSSSGRLYVNGDVDREHPALIASDGLLYIIVKVCLSVCLSVGSHIENNTYRFLQNFIYMMSVAVARSCSDENAIYFSCLDLERPSRLRGPPPPLPLGRRTHTATVLLISD